MPITLLLWMLFILVIVLVFAQIAHKWIDKHYTPAAPAVDYLAGIDAKIEAAVDNAFAKQPQPVKTAPAA